MSCALLITCNEKPKGFLYFARMCFELAMGANAWLCSVISSSRSDIWMDVMIYKHEGKSAR